MIQAFWFLVQIAALIGGAIWLLSHPGQTVINWFDYTLTIQNGILFFALATLFLMLIGIYHIFYKLTRLPKTISHYRERSRHKKGLLAITHTLSALAAGNGKTALKQAEKTRHLLPKGHGLPLLLEAQSAYLYGKKGLAQNKFEQLLDHKDTNFLGIHGLLKMALDQRNYKLALHYARSAISTNKENAKQFWLVMATYQLELKNHLWDNAFETSKHLIKLPKVKQDDSLLNKIKSDQVAIHLLHHDHYKDEGNDIAAYSALQLAYKINPAFAPTIDRLCAHYLNHDKPKKAISLIKKSWKKSPHPDLATWWENLSPYRKQSNVKGKKLEEKSVQWTKTLIALNKENAESHIACAKKAIDLQLWYLARESLEKAQHLSPPTARIFRLLAIVEQNAGLNDQALDKVMQRAGQALPDKTWTCQETGLVYQEWNAIADPHGSFNTIIWDRPVIGTRTANTHYIPTGGTTSFLATPPDIITQ